MVDVTCTRCGSHYNAEGVRRLRKLGHARYVSDASKPEDGVALRFVMCHCDSPLAVVEPAPVQTFASCQECGKDFSAGQWQSLDSVCIAQVTPSGEWLEVKTCRHCGASVVAQHAGVPETGAMGRLLRSGRARLRRLPGAVGRAFVSIQLRVLLNLVGVVAVVIAAIHLRRITDLRGVESMEALSRAMTHAAVSIRQSSSSFGAAMQSTTTADEAAAQRVVAAAHDLEAGEAVMVRAMANADSNLRLAATSLTASVDGARHALGAFSGRIVDASGAAGALQTTLTEAEASVARSVDDVHATSSTVVHAMADTAVRAGEANNTLRVSTANLATALTEASAASGTLTAAANRAVVAARNAEAAANVTAAALAHASRPSTVEAAQNESGDAHDARSPATTQPTSTGPGARTVPHS